MIKFFKKIIKYILHKIGYSICLSSELERLKARDSIVNDIEFLKNMPTENLSNLINYLPLSKSQLRQDLFVLSNLNFRKHGYFVEFGATDGIGLSNTFLLEKEFEWTGILAEPAKCWKKNLSENRNVSIENLCVWKKSGETLKFSEVDIAELSTIDIYKSSDLFDKARKSSFNYSVGTISLLDLLDKYNAPQIIDYLSIDTEGSEFEILSNFDFDKYKFRVITCEHNYTTAREKIHSLLKKNGYVRVLENISQFDDWYVLAS